MLATTQNFLNSPNAILATCIGSWAVTSITVEDLIDHPIRSVFWPLVCGSIAGTWISNYTPVGFAPYVAGGLALITASGLCARALGLRPKPPGGSLIKNIATELGRNSNMKRISYNAHTLINDKGLIIETGDVLCSETVKTLLLKWLELLDSNIIPNIDKIGEILECEPYLDRMSGIFIHNGFKGYVTINGPNKTSIHVLSIKIDP